MIPNAPAFATNSAGLSARDYTAIQLAAAWLSTYGSDAEHPCANSQNSARVLANIANMSYRMADALVLQSQQGTATHNPKTESKLWLAVFHHAGNSKAITGYHVFHGSENEAQAEAEELARARGESYDWLATETKLEDL